MKGKFTLLWLLPVLLLSAVACADDPLYNTNAAVHVKEQNGQYTLYRNGKPFHIQGVAGHTHLPLLQQIGGNTIRTYDTTNLGRILDEAHRNNLAVIAGIYLPVSSVKWLYANDSVVDAYHRAIGKVVNKHKNHPALLMWCLGNELGYYNFTNFDFPRAYNRFVDTIIKADGNHPVTTAMANFSERALINFRLHIPDVELFLFNTFGRLHMLEDDMAPYRLIWNGPFAVGEYGEMGPWETHRTQWGAPIELNSTEKAARMAAEYKENLPADNPRYLGALAFYWGQRQEVTHTWFNFFSESGRKSAPVYTLARLWDQPLKGKQPPEIESLQINGSREYNRFIFDVGSTQSARLKIKALHKDSLDYHWAVRPEDWYFKKLYKPDSVGGLFREFNPATGAFTFTVPQRKGPYRLFVKVVDKHGNFSVANLPFYVVR